MQQKSDEKLSPHAQRGKELNQKLGMLWGRFWAIVVALAGIALMLWFFTSVETMTLGSVVFISAIGIGMLLVARHLWRNKDGFTETIDGKETPTRLRDR